MSGSPGRSQEGDGSQAAASSGNGQASETTAVSGVASPSRGCENPAATVPHSGADASKSGTTKDAGTSKDAGIFDAADTPNGPNPQNHTDRSGPGDASHEGSTLVEAGPSRSVSSSYAGQRTGNSHAAANTDNAAAPSLVCTAPRAGAASETVAPPNANAPMEAVAGSSAPGSIGLVDDMIDYTPAWLQAPLKKCASYITGG
ncbi:MAG: hypothetical protein Q9201_001004 [Fulgogasparrea decipioides]